MTLLVPRPRRFRSGVGKRKCRHCGRLFGLSDFSFSAQIPGVNAAALELPDDCGCCKIMQCCNNPAPAKLRWTIDSVSGSNCETYLASTAVGQYIEAVGVFDGFTTMHYNPTSLTFPTNTTSPGPGLCNLTFSATMFITVNTSHNANNCGDGSASLAYGGDPSCGCDGSSHFGNASFGGWGTVGFGAPDSVSIAQKLTTCDPFLMYFNMSAPNTPPCSSNLSCTVTVRVEEVP